MFHHGEGHPYQLVVRIHKRFDSRKLGFPMTAAHSNDLAGSRPSNGYHVEIAARCRAEPRGAPWNKRA